MLTCDIDFSDYERSVERSTEIIGFGVRDAVRNAAVEGAAEARLVGPFQDRTGRLRASIVAQFVSSSQYSAKWLILAGAPYARFVEEGTRPHVILPRNGAVLRFTVGGSTVFAARVNHPGTHPYPYMGPAYLKAERVMYREFDLMLEKLERVWAE